MPSPWPSQFRNSETGRAYQPHHALELEFLCEDRPRYGLAKGGEGGGKSVVGIVKDLQRLRRGMSGIMVSPDFEHFKRSLWPEFRRWCPWNAVVERDRYRRSPDWEASKPFALHFYAENGSITTLYCGGIEDPSGWEGPNVSFAHFDEARRAKTPDALKVLDGRVRITGPQGEPPQLWMTTTPRKHWLFEYFGPLIYNDAGEVDDPRAAFKQDARVITLLTLDNERAGNLSAGYTDKRAQSLTEAEKRVLLAAEWDDIDAAERFLPSLAMWDGCREELAPLDPRAPIVLAADAGVINDCFALVGMSRHPVRPKEAVAVRIIRLWEPKGRPLDFDVIEGEIADLLRDRAHFNIVQLAYDKYQLHQMMTRLGKLVWTKEFNQQAERLIADKQLLDLIMQRRIAHDGNLLLRKHIDNADRKSDGEGKLRLVKRADNLKIDLAVSLSMASAECLRLNL